MPTYSDEEDYLACIPFTGAGSKLPAQSILPRGFDVRDFCEEVKVAPFSGAVLKVVVDEEVYQTFIETYGVEALDIVDANGIHLTRPQWKEKYGTDGLVGLIIRKLNLDKYGTGVQVHRVGGVKK